MPWTLNNQNFHSSHQLSLMSAHESKFVTSHQLSFTVPPHVTEPPSSFVASSVVPSIESDFMPSLSCGLSSAHDHNDQTSTSPQPQHLMMTREDAGSQRLSEIREGQHVTRGRQEWNCPQSASPSISFTPSRSDVASDNMYLQERQATTTRDVVNNNPLGTSNTMSTGSRNANITTNSSPQLVIVEQPTNRIRYRYKSEKGSHGGLTGENNSQAKKTYPTVRVGFLSYYVGAVLKRKSTNLKFLHFLLFFLQS